MINAKTRLLLGINGRNFSKRVKECMNSLVRMSSLYKAAPGVAYTFSETKELLEEFKSQMEAVEELKRSEQTGESHEGPQVPKIWYITPHHTEILHHMFCCGVVWWKKLTGSYSTTTDQIIYFIHVHKSITFVNDKIF